MKIIALLLCLLLAAPLSALAEEPVLVNRVADPALESPFAGDDDLLEIYFPKISGVDAAFMRYGDTTMLIDCAGNQWEAVEELLTELNVTRLTYAVNTHPDADHIGGFQHILAKFPADQFICGFPEDYPDTDAVCHKVYDKLRELNIPSRLAVDGETLPFGDVTVRVCQLQDKTAPRVNNRSVTLMVDYGERSIYFTGDIQMIAQLAFVELRDKVDFTADIIKFPHHAYARMQEKFLSMVAPVFTVATNNEMLPEIRDQLKAHGVRYALTSRGVLRLATDGRTWLVERP